MVEKTLTFCLIEESPAEFFGLTTVERLRRSFSGLPVKAVSLGEAASIEGALLLLRGDYVLDKALIQALATSPGTALYSSEIVGIMSAGSNDREQAMALIEGKEEPSSFVIVRRTPEELLKGADNNLRKKHNPLILKISDWKKEEIEESLFAASYKGVTDFVTKYIWPKPALWATRFCANRKISPNQVTLLSAFLVLMAFGLFWYGAFLPGLIAAWSMCFLDTVDGKLARVTLRSTKWGNVFDHGIDLIHPPFWYWAWYTALQPASFWLESAFWIVVVGYVIGRLQEGWFLWRFGFEIHSWQKLDSRFREITARRNPNLAILSVAALLGAPDIGFELVALWTLISLGFHFFRIFQAEKLHREGYSPISWFSSSFEGKA